MTRGQTERRNIQQNSSAAVFLLLGFFTLGFIAGTVIWNKLFSADSVVMIVGIADSFTACDSFFSAFRSAALPIIPFFIITALSGFFAFGWITVPLMVFFRAVGFGAAACCLCSINGVESGVKTALLIAPNAIVTVLLLFAAVAAAKQSRSFFAGQSAGSGMLSGYLIRMLIFALLISAVVAIQAELCVMLF